jgi:hypothetical protein
MDSGEAALSRVESQESRAFRWRFALFRGSLLPLFRDGGMFFFLE